MSSSYAYRSAMKNGKQWLAEFEAKERQEMQESKT